MKIRKKAILHIVRILIGVVFIISALLKLFPADPFELFVFENGIQSWDFASIASRLLISLELFLGVMLITNLFSKFVLKLNLLVLSGFTLLLIYLAVTKPEMENCHCFSERFELSPLESIYKNIILLIGSFYIFKNRIPFRLKFQKLILIIVIVASVTLPVVVQPPAILMSTGMIEMNEELDTSYLWEIQNDKKGIDLENEKTLICFLSMECKYCRYAAKRISVIDDSFDNSLPVLFVFLGEEDNLKSFWEESESNEYPYVILSQNTFVALAGKSIPMIYFIDKGMKKGKIRYQYLTQKEVKEFFE